MGNPSGWLWNRTWGRALVSRRKSRLMEGMVDLDGDVSSIRQVHGVKSLIVAVSYRNVKGPRNQTIAPLRSLKDARKIMRLLMLSGCTGDDIILLTDEQYQGSSGLPTIPNFKKALEGIGSKIHPDDVFVFYFVGHGRVVQHPQKDPNMPKEESLALIHEDLSLDRFSMLFAEELFYELDVSFDPRVRILNIFDCCNSAGVTDFLSHSGSFHQERSMVAVAACQGSELAYEYGFGGVFTQALSRAVSKYDDEREARAKQEEVNILDVPSYMLAHVYNGMLLWMFTKGYSSGKVRPADVHGPSLLSPTQEMSCVWTENTQPAAFPWVLSRHSYLVVLGPPEIDIYRETLIKKRMLKDSRSVSSFRSSLARKHESKNKSRSVSSQHTSRSFKVTSKPVTHSFIPPSAIGLHRD